MSDLYLLYIQIEKCGRKACIEGWKILLILTSEKNNTKTHKTDIFKGDIFCFMLTLFLGRVMMIL